MDNILNKFRQVADLKTTDIGVVLYKKEITGSKIGGNDGTVKIDQSQMTGGVLTLLKEQKSKGQQIIVSPKVYENPEAAPAFDLTVGKDDAGKNIIYVNFPVSKEDYNTFTQDASDTVIWSLTHNERVAERIEGLTTQFQKSTNNQNATTWEMLDAIKEKRDRVMAGFDKTTATLAELLGQAYDKKVMVKTTVLDQVMPGVKAMDAHREALPNAKFASIYDHHSGMVEIQDHVVSTQSGEESILKHPLVTEFFAGMASYDIATVHVGDNKAENLAANYDKLGINHSNQQITAVQRGINPPSKRAGLMQDVAALEKTLATTLEDEFSAAALQEIIAELGNKQENSAEKQELEKILPALQVQDFINETKAGDKKLVAIAGRCVPYKEPLDLLKQSVKFIEENPEQASDTNFLVLLTSTRAGTPGQEEYEQEVQEYYDSLEPKIQEKIFLRIGQTYPAGVFANFIGQSDVLMQGVMENSQEGFGLQGLEFLNAANELGYLQDKAGAAHKDMVAFMRGENPASASELYPFEYDLGAYRDLAYNAISAGLRRVTNQAVSLPNDVMHPVLDKAIVTVIPGMGMAEPYADAVYGCNHTSELSDTLLVALTDTHHNRAEKVSAGIQQIESITSAHYGEVTAQMAQQTAR